MKRLLPLLILAIIVVPVTAMDWGYHDGYQGLDISFYAIEYQGYLYTSDDAGPNPNYLSYREIRDSWKGHNHQFIVTDPNLIASATKFRDSLNWDPDHPTQGKPNLYGSIDAISVDYLDRTITWNITTPTITTTNGTHTTTSWNVTTVQMDEYVCSFNINLGTGGHHKEGYPDEHNDLSNIKLWIRVRNNSPSYIDGVEPPQFALGLVQLDEPIEWSNPNVGALQSIYPGSRGETLGVYYAPDGEAIPDFDPYTIQGHTLDPTLFRPDVYLCINVNHLEPAYDQKSFWDANWYEQHPSGTQHYTARVFCIGEWTVQLETTKKIELEPHDPQTRTAPTVSFPNTINPLLNLVPWWVWTGIWIGIAGLICYVVYKAWQWIIPTVKHNIKKIR